MYDTQLFLPANEHLLRAWQVAQWRLADLCCHFLAGAAELTNSVVSDDARYTS